MDTILEMVRRQRELDFAPGEEEQYSNTGYNLLAATVAKVTGQSFRTWTDRNLFQPLGMKYTLVCDNPAEVILNRAISYAPDGPNRFHQVVSQLAAQGSSSLFISAEDMGRWLLNFQTARVGGTAAIELMQKPATLNNGEKRGLCLRPRARQASGNEDRFPWRQLGRLPQPHDLGAGKALCRRRPGEHERHGYLGSGLEDHRPLSRNPRYAFEVGLRPAARRSESGSRCLEPFLGTYRLGPGWLLTITREGDQLMTQATHEEKCPMTPVSDTNFFVEAYGAPVAFVRESSGAVTNLLYRGINAPKLTLPESTPARLAAYAGDYWSEELRVVTRLEIHDGSLAVCLRSGRWIHLLPTGADSFDTDYGGIALQFTRNAAAEVTEVKLSGSRVRNLRHTRVTLPKT